jgi:hypothetical protein
MSSVFVQICDTRLESGQKVGMTCRVLDYTCIRTGWEYIRSQPCNCDVRVSMGTAQMSEVVPCRLRDLAVHGINRQRGSENGSIRYRSVVRVFGTW